MVKSFVVQAPGKPYFFAKALLFFMAISPTIHLDLLPYNEAGSSFLKGGGIMLLGWRRAGLERTVS